MTRAQHVAIIIVTCNSARHIAVCLRFNPQPLIATFAFWVLGRQTAREWGHRANWSVVKSCRQARDQTALLGELLLPDTGRRGWAGRLQRHPRGYARVRWNRYWARRYVDRRAYVGAWGARQGNRPANPANWQLGHHRFM